MIKPAGSESRNGFLPGPPAMGVTGPNRRPGVPDRASSLALLKPPIPGEKRQRAGAVHNLAAAPHLAKQTRSGDWTPPLAP
jgi:hypothetical protein